MKLMLSYMTMMIILNSLFLVTMKLSKKSKFNKEKNSPFECGFNQMSSPRKPFSIQFFLMGMMFLIFDIEISLILPMIIKTSNQKEWLISSSLSIMILIMGLINEWKLNMLEWSK